MTPEERGWVAGIIDGEGCVCISRQAPGSGGRLNPSHRLYLRVTMGHEQTVRRLAELTGTGSVHLVKVGHWNDAWLWSVSTRAAGAILTDLRPLFVTKAAEVDVALEFCALPPRTTSMLTPAVVAARESCFERIRDLKPSARFRSAS